MKKSIDHPRSNSTVTAVVAATLLSQASGCISLNFGKQETTVVDRYGSPFDDFETRLENTHKVRDSLRDCVLNAPPEHPQFEKSSQERFRGSSEKGKFVYDDERGREVKVNVESEKGSFSRDEIRIWGGTQEEALKACEDAY